MTLVENEHAERGPVQGVDQALRGEIARLNDEIRRLESELERYHAHAQRTSNLFLRATDFSAWVRANARREAELVLSKARARANEIVGEAERERKRAEDETLRLHAVASRARARLHELTTDALRLLEAEDGAEPPRTRPVNELQDALERRLAASHERPADPASTQSEEDQRW